MALAVGATALVRSVAGLVAGYPVRGGQGIRYLVAALLLFAWARIRRRRLPRPSGREWAALAASAWPVAACWLGRWPRAAARRLVVAALVVTVGAGVAQIGSGGGAPASTRSACCCRSGRRSGPSG